MPASAPGTDFGLADILGDAFAALKAHFGMIVGCFVAFALIQAVCGKLPLLSLFIAPPLLAGFSLVLLKTLHGTQPPAFSDLFKGFSYYIPVLTAGLLMTLLLFLGLCCLLIPGIIFALMWSQTMFVLADGILDVEAAGKDKAALSGWGAMKRSAALMSGHKLRFLGYCIVLAVIGLCGAVAAGIGLLVTMPFAWLAGAAFYSRLPKAS